MKGIVISKLRAEYGYCVGILSVCVAGAKLIFFFHS